MVDSSKISVSDLCLAQNDMEYNAFKFLKCFTCKWYREVE